MTYTLILLLSIPGLGDIPYVEGTYETKRECEAQAAASYNREFPEPGMYVKATSCLEHLEA